MHEYKISCPGIYSSGALDRFIRELDIQHTNSLGFVYIKKLFEKKDQALGIGVGWRLMGG